MHGYKLLIIAITKLPVAYHLRQAKRPSDAFSCRPGNIFQFCNNIAAILLRLIYMKHSMYLSLAVDFKIGLLFACSLKIIFKNTFNLATILPKIVCSFLLRTSFIRLSAQNFPFIYFFVKNDING